MKEESPHKARWSVLLFAATLVLGSLGLAGCPDDDDDDDFFDKGPRPVVEVDSEEHLKN